MKIKVNNTALATLLKVKPGIEIDVPSKNDIPINLEWRNRFKDSKIDGCITISKPQKPKNEPITKDKK